MNEEKMMISGLENGAGAALYDAISNCAKAMLDFWGPEDNMTFEQKTVLKLFEHWSYTVSAANRGWSGPITDAGLFNILLAAEEVREIDAALNSELLIACTDYHFSREGGEL